MSFRQEPSLGRNVRKGGNETNALGSGVGTWFRLLRLKAPVMVMHRNGVGKAPSGSSGRVVSSLFCRSLLVCILLLRWDLVLRMANRTFNNESAIFQLLKARQP